MAHTAQVDRERQHVMDRKSGCRALAVLLVSAVAALLAPPASAQESIRQTLLLSRGSAAIFLSRPITAAFLVTAIAVVLLPVIVPRLRAAVAKLASLEET